MLALNKKSFYPSVLCRKCHPTNDKEFGELVAAVDVREHTQSAGLTALTHQYFHEHHWSVENGLQKEEANASILDLEKSITTFAEVHHHFCESPSPILRESMTTPVLVHVHSRRS